MSGPVKVKRENFFFSNEAFSALARSTCYRFGWKVGHANGMNSLGQEVLRRVMRDCALTAVRYARADAAKQHEREVAA